MKNSTFPAIILLALVTLAAAPQPAGAQDDSHFDGEIHVGYRTVDVDGADRKYREDINQDDGPVLYRLQFDLVPDPGLRKYADRIELDVNDFGSQPFETLHFGIRKYGSYNFELHRRESEYFYEDIILPLELASVRSSTGGDFHHFDFERVSTGAKLELELSPAAQLRFGFDQFTKKGESTTSVDISRDEFEVDKPIDEKLRTSTLGFTYSWDKATLILEERLREYENVFELFLPGFSEGASEGPATLDFYFFDQPYDFDTNEHSLKLLARPNDKLDIRLSAEIHDQSLNLHAEERIQGISFRGDSFSVDDVGSGSIERDLELYDIDLTYLVSDRFGIVGSVRRYSLDQAGDSTLGSDINSSDWDIDTTGFEGGFVCYINKDFSIGAGVIFESRDVDFTQLENGDGPMIDESTDSDGYYVNAAWNPGTGLELSAKVDINSIDDPLTFATPTDRSRIRFRARYRWDSGFWLSGIYQFQDLDNDLSGWAAETGKTALRLGYRKNGVEASFGYTLIDIDRQIDSFVNEFLLFNDLFQADADFLVGQVRWKANQRLTVGASARLYDNGGSFAVKRDDLRAFVEIGLSEDYLLGFAYRTIDYDEDDFAFDDYEADIAELSLGYRF